MTTTDTTQALLAKLWEAARKGDTATIRRLAIHNEIDLDTPNAQGHSAFSLALQNQHTDTARTIHALWLASRQRPQLEDIAGETVYNYGSATH